MQEPEALTDEQRIKEREALRDEFEQWWEREGEYLRAGGGQYEKTFACHAWQAATERARSLLPAPSSEPVATIYEPAPNDNGNTRCRRCDQPAQFAITAGVRSFPACPCGSTAFNARIDAHPPSVPAAGWQPSDGDELWLWRNGDHFLAFQHLYPCYSPGGDPMVLGEPFGRAVYRSSYDRAAAPKAVPAATIPQRSLDPDLRQAMADHAFELYEGEAVPAADVQGMTDEEIESIAAQFIAEDWDDHLPGYYRNMNIVDFARAVIAALQSKGNRE